MDWQNLGEIVVGQNWTYSDLTNAEWFKLEQTNAPPGKGLLLSQWDGQLQRVEAERVLSGSEPQTFHLPAPATLNPSRRIGLKLRQGDYIANWRVKIYSTTLEEAPPPDPTAAIADQFPSIPSTRRAQILAAATAAANGQSFSSDDVLTTLATLDHWWQCTDSEAVGVAAGGLVQAISPYIGSCSLTQPSESARAIFTATGLQFNGGKYYTADPAVRLGDSSAFTLLFCAITGGAQSVFRFQDPGSTFIVFPWGVGSGTARFIISTDRGTNGPGIPTPTDGQQILVASWKKNTANGFYIRKNGTVGQMVDAADAATPNDNITVGRYLSGTEFLVGNIQSLVVSKVQYSTAQLTQLERFFNAYNGFTIF